MFGKFHTDRHYLLRYLLTWCLVLGGVTAILWKPPTETGPMPDCWQSRWA